MPKPQQIVLSRYDRGTDWGAPRRLLVRANETGYELFIVQGFYTAVGVRGFGREYHRATLALKGPSPFSCDGYYTKFLAEGRISRATLKANFELIDAVFGEGTAEKIDLRGTLELP